ncbi:type I DNA topoisomerase, partial [Patescibacteria group bacterium]|nr:type I DNA topoisomerase [Patescibacteria group bacterium]
LKQIAAESEKVILATDEDREGEAIAWHLTQILDLGKPESAERIVFHEITKSAIKNALNNPQHINMHLVDAQQARRILDRLVGYELSPFLWKKIRYGLSAGRVQSVAVRLIVEREEEINKFKPEEYWEIKSKVRKVRKVKSPFDITQGEQELNKEFEARLVKINSDALPKLGIKTKEEAEKIKNELEKAEYKVSEISKKETRKYPLPPFTTSTLQQTANNILGYSAKQTMMIAQQLYEGVDLGPSGSLGLITYMRTDSLNLSEESLMAAKKYIIEKFGKDYAAREPRRYKTKSKGAQEAHEAIRPTNPDLNPENIKEYLDPRQYKLYKLIWQRMVSAQMAEAVVDSTMVDILGSRASNESSASSNYTLRANGSVIKFDGFLKVYPSKFEYVILPELKKGEKLDLVKVAAEQHFTAPPARYGEASLIKTLEEFGIGRPSTYAPIIDTIEGRGYVQKTDKRFLPTEIGILVNKLLVEHFPKIVDVGFTAEMEKNLDEIAESKKQWVPTIREFYIPFKENLLKKEREINKKDLTEEKTDEQCPKCGSLMIIKLGRFGKFMACANYPACKTTKPIGEEKKLKELFANEKCALCGAPMQVKHGRFGAFLGCSKYPACKNIKKIEKTIGVKCPKCGAGEVVEKKGKFKKIFYGCNKYPECDYASWKKPSAGIDTEANS